MDGALSDPHEFVVAPELAPPVGFSHAVVARGDRIVFLGGQVAHGPDGAITGDTILEQFDVAADNVVTALRAAGGEPEHIVSMTIYVTDPEAYRAAMPDLGAVWRRHFGPRYPAMAWFGVSALLDEDALVELVATAVIP